MGCQGWKLASGCCQGCWLCALRLQALHSRCCREGPCLRAAAACLQAASAVSGALVRGLSAIDRSLEGSGQLKELKPAEGPSELQSFDQELKERCLEVRGRAAQCC